MLSLSPVLDLDRVAVRVKRDGRFVSEWVSNLRYLTDLELVGMPREVGRCIEASLAAAENSWHYNSMTCVWENRAHE